MRIDYIFVSSDLQPVATRTLSTAASDHRPVESIVRITPGIVPPRR
jgi:endonuclease/exonuclease/phosphatase (EEP) superfamily protein YafD